MKERSVSIVNRNFKHPDFTLASAFVAPKRVNATAGQTITGKS
jgi:hypothetical protein